MSVNKLLLLKGKSVNPLGRPCGQNSLAVFRHKPDLFFVRHIRWWRFCLEYFVAMGNGAEAANTKDDRQRKELVDHAKRNHNLFD